MARNLEDAAFGIKRIWDQKTQFERNLRCCKAVAIPALEMVFQHSTVNSSTGNHSPAEQGQLQGWKSFSYTAKEIAAQQGKFPHCNCMIRQPVRQRNKAMRSPGEYRGCLAGASPGDPRHDGLATVA